MNPQELSDEELARIAGVTLQPAEPARPQATPAVRDSRPRGIRNNNPGNIEDGAFARSLPGYQGSDGRFAIFDSPEAGGAAKERLLGSYLRRGFDTPAEIINRWAPPSDNNPTNAYANYVARGLGIGPNDPVPPERIGDVARLIGEFENGTQRDYRVVNSSLTTETPNQLSAQGFKWDEDGQTWARTVGYEARPEEMSDADLMALAGIQPQEAPTGVEAVRQSDGYQQAMAREQELNRFRDVGFTSQATAPINDEIGYAVGYGAQALGNLGRRFTGRDVEVTAQQAGRAAMDNERALQDAYQRERPVSSAAGQILGGFALGPARAASAVQGAAQLVRPSVGQAYRQAAGVGAAYGAAEADGGIGQRALGSGLGATAGVATAGLIDGGLAGVSRLRNPAPPASDRRVGRVMQRALEADRLAPQDYLNSLRQLPQGQLPLDAGGPNLQGVAEVLAQTPGPARTRLTEALTARRGQTPDRVRSRVAEDLGGQGDYFATLDRTIQARREAANQTMAEIGDRPFRLSDDAVQSLRSEMTQRELRQEAENALGSPNPERRNTGAVLNRLADVVLDNPGAAELDVRSAQNISRALLDASDAAWRSGGGSRATSLGELGRAIRGNARDAVPEYNGWLQRYGDESSQIEALELGRRIFRNADDPSADGMSAEVLRRQFGEMSETAQDMFRKGVGEAIVARARTSRGDIGAMRDLMRSEEFADRIKIAFPDERAFTRFMNAAEAEVGMANRDNAILQNSRTAFRQNAGRWLGDPGVEQAANTLSNTSLTGLGLEAGRQAVRAAGRRMGANRSIAQNERLNALAGDALADPAVMERLLSQQLKRRYGLFGGRTPAGVAGMAYPAIPF